MKEYERLLQLINLVQDKAAGQPDDYIRATLARHCCILGCAALEVGIKEIINAYVRARCNTMIQRFVEIHIRNLNSPTPNNVLDLINKFDHDRAEKVRLFMERNASELKEEIASLVGQRNVIAHGRNSDISFGRLTPWLKGVREVLEYCEREIFI